ncbi:thioredoxin family protein [Polaribacter uvawellassae]|uniref:thioredoxin family protein n=1 Tax=Polaribacter uvawellassae TaxID=3133495 RepID=UPI00321AFE89
MKKLIFVFALTFIVNSYAQEQSKATRNASGDLVGITHKEDFNQLPYSKWFNVNYHAYTPDAKSISKLKKKLKNVKIKAFVATWCHLSKKDIPRTYKILEQAGFDFNNIEFISLNRGKSTPDNLQKDLNIKSVPTFIFYKKGEEIGRYIEYPQQNLEKDFLTIVSGKKYK